jgi:small subunit ribosomal protein S6
MEKYELLYILPAKYTDAEIKGLAEKIGGIVTGAGGKIAETHDLGRRRLSYPIQHVRQGHYVLVHFEAETPVVGKLNETFRLSTDILRHLIIRRDPHITKIPTLVDHEEIRTERDEEGPRQMQRRAPPPQMVRKAPEAAPVTMEDLDKKLDEILTEEVL